MARHRDRRSFESAGTAGDATAVASGNTAKTQPTASAEPPRAFAATRGKKGMRPAATVHSMAQSTQDAASTLRFAALRLAGAGSAWRSPCRGLSMRVSSATAP